MSVDTVGVVGTGQMGSGIAQVAALAGCSVIARDVDDAALERGRKAIERSLARLVEKGNLEAAASEAALGRVRFTRQLDDLAASDLVIEAVVEDLALKLEVWRALDAACPAETVFASNTSSLSITEMAAATGRADRMVGLHFFNPVPIMPLVEVVRGLETSAETLALAHATARRFGKETIESRDTAGFVVNRLLVPYLLDAVRALEQGLGSTAEIDRAMTLGCGHPMGPLALLDFVGLDTAARIGDILFEEFREPRMAPPPLLRRMVAAGRHGRKSGAGFYDHAQDPPVPLAVT